MPFCFKNLDGINKPFLFLGHRDIIIGVFFGTSKKTNGISYVYTLSRDGLIGMSHFSMIQRRIQ